MIRQREYFETLLADRSVSKEDKKNIRAYLRFVQRGNTANHLGRYVLVHDGVMFPESFLSPQDAFRDDIPNYGQLFLLPCDGDIANLTSAQALCPAVSDRDQQGIFQEPIVAIELTAAAGKDCEEMTSGPLKDLVDTNSSDTNCPVTYTTVKDNIADAIASTATGASAGASRVLSAGREVFARIGTLWVSESRRTAFLTR
jgi:hypothetical protein